MASVRSGDGESHKLLHSQCRQRDSLGKTRRRVPLLTCSAVSGGPSAALTAGQANSGTRRASEGLSRRPLASVAGSCASPYSALDGRGVLADRHDEGYHAIRMAANRRKYTESDGNDETS